MTSTHPAPELLLPYALGAHDAATAQHVEGCPMCRSEIEHWQETAGLLRGTAVLERRTETPDCLDELVVADFVDGRLGADTRGPVVAHLLSCARCRALVTAASRLSAETTVTDQTPARRWRRWSMGLAAAAALVLLLVPPGGDDSSPPGLREPTDTSIHAPQPITPRGPVERVDRLLWASVTGVERYRVRLYNDEGDVLWTTETADTLVALPDSVGLSPLATYFWKVEAQTEWRRWVASDLVEFRLIGPGP
jgi:anti-sigma factor ChrR (cupin superfamily)